jgi:hypothetical protein
VVNSKEGNINKELTKCRETIVRIHQQDCGFGKCLACDAEELDITQLQDYFDLCAVCSNKTQMQQYSDRGGKTRVNICGLFMILPEKNPVVLQSVRLINETYFHWKNPKNQNKYVGALKT